MRTAKLQIGQDQFLVQIEESHTAPIPVPMPMGGVLWQYEKKSKIKVRGETLPDLPGRGPHTLEVGNEIFEFQLLRFLGNKCWEGQITCAET